jgi:hypothetical protein
MFALIASHNHERCHDCCSGEELPWRGRAARNIAILTDRPRVMGLCYGVTLKLIVSLVVNICCISFI